MQRDRTSRTVHAASSVIEDRSDVVDRLLRLQLVALSAISAIIALDHRRWNCQLLRRRRRFFVGAHGRGCGQCCARLSSRAAWPSWLYSAASQCENGPAASSNAAARACGPLECQVGTGPLRVKAQLLWSLCLRMYVGSSHSQGQPGGVRGLLDLSPS